ncbi:MAG TPA: rod shape-determining protein RodA [Clostridiaceae bacterium]|nr:rod shape-determining protein RodA [Clostridiaceae bacterium]
MYSVQKTKDINFFKQFDYILFFSVLLLSIIGVVVLDSATHMAEPAVHARYMKTQIFSIILGVIAAITISVIDYKYYLKTLGFVLYGLCIALLVVVLFKGVGESWGSKSWLRAPFVGSFQPSEIAKIAFIICGSIFLERLKESQKDRVKNIIKYLVYSAIPIALIFKQPDYGMVVAYMVILICMLFIYGIKYKYIFITVGAAAATTPFIWFFALNEKRKARIIEFIMPGTDKLNSGWQILRAQMAIGSGQLFGSGLYKGMQTQNDGVPVKESDFIFTVIGEELGFIGAMVVLILIFCILLRCIYIAKNSRDLFGSYMVIGITAMLGYQFFQNIGMCVRLLPVTGIPLPFVSAGGSAMVTNYIAIGIALSVSVRKKKAIFNGNK